MKNKKLINIIFFLIISVALTGCAALKNFSNSKFFKACESVADTMEKDRLEQNRQAEEWNRQHKEQQKEHERQQMQREIHDLHKDKFGW